MDVLSVFLIITMWIFGYGSKKKAASRKAAAAAAAATAALSSYSSSRIRAAGARGGSYVRRQVYAVDDGTGAPVAAVHACALDAIVEASKIELVSPGGACAIRAIEVLEHEFDLDEVDEMEASVDLEVRLTLEQLPPSARVAVEERRAAEAARLAERAERVIRVADAIRETWHALNDEFKAKEARCTAAKSAAAASFVRDRGMSAARVREICDANDMALQLARDALKDRGEKLVRNALGRASSITLDTVLPALM